MTRDRNAMLTIFIAIACSLFGGCVEEPGDADKNLDRAALEQFVERAMKEEVGVEEAQATYEGLSDAEREAIADMLKERLGSEAKERSPGGMPAQAAGSIWSQSIENVWTNGIPVGSVFGTWTYVDWNCDDDPNDMEYVVYYPFPAFSPSSVRWTTTSSQVYVVFMAAYGGNLLGFGYNYGEVRMCIGDRGVTLAGGPAKVQSTVFVHY